MFNLRLIGRIVCVSFEFGWPSFCVWCAFDCEVDLCLVRV